MALIALLVLGLFLVYLPQAHVNTQRVQCMENLPRLGQGIMLFHGVKEGPSEEGQRRLSARSKRRRGLRHLAGANRSPAQRCQSAQGLGHATAYNEQPAAVREAIWPLLLCPARQRPGWLAGEGDQHAPWRLRLRLR